jgi:hypothetical protein
VLSETAFSRTAESFLTSAGLVKGPCSLLAVVFDSSCSTDFLSVEAPKVLFVFLMFLIYSSILATSADPDCNRDFAISSSLTAES